MHVILAAFEWGSPAAWLVVLKVAIGLGMVIFVHELGHFLVAKACGVKCEKFYLGFDVFGLRLARFRWGETEYGIGLIPLGGYVKMLGQDDNPGAAAEELRQARLAREAAGTDGAPSQTSDAAPESAAIDPRSYLAKSVPQRMAIISAGVVMNVIFAFVLATWAYMNGVNEFPCVVGNVQPGQAAWKAGVQPGDKIVQIGDTKNPIFRDLQSNVALGSDIENGVSFVIERPGHEGLIDLKLVPQYSGLAHMVGITSPLTTTLGKPPIAPGAQDVQGARDFKDGDRVIQLGETPVSTYAEVIRYLARNRGPLRVTVSRPANPKEPETSEASDVTIDLASRPLRTLPGVTMRMGPVAAVQAGSSAEAAGIRAGDVIRGIDGDEAFDPVMLPSIVAQRVGQTVTLNILRDKKPIDIVLEAREPIAYDDSPLGRETPMGIPELGIAYQVTSVFERAEGAAANAGLKPGDVIVNAALVPPDMEAETLKEKYGAVPDSVSITLGDDRNDWPKVFFVLQEILPGSTVVLTLADKREVTLEPVDSKFLNPDRGFMFGPLYELHKAATLAEASQLGVDETASALTLVFRFLRNIGTNVSIKATGGPVSIFQAAFHSAESGLSELLMFLCMLSANLAVINFLPIPVLDGGHMVFLALEGIRGKPVSERVVIAFTYVGLLFILSLMSFVLLLDLNFIPRFS